MPQLELDVLLVGFGEVLDKQIHHRPYIVNKYQIPQSKQPLLVILIEVGFLGYG